MAKTGRPKLPPRATPAKPVKLSPVGKLVDEAQRTFAKQQRALARHERQPQTDPKAR